MNIIFRTSHAQLHNRYWTAEEVRSFMASNKDSAHKAVQYNMNFYKLTENGMLVHVYDAYEVDNK